MENPHDEPPAWRIRNVTVSNPFGDGFAAGSGLVHVEDGHIYTYGDLARKEGGWTVFDSCLLRWRVADALAGRLTDAEVWLPREDRWAPEHEVAEVPSIFEPRASPGYSVHHDARLGRWVQVQATGFGHAPLELRVAPSKEGPWSPLGRLYDPPEMRDSALYTYAAKAHPHLGGADLVLTYSTGTDDAERLRRDLDIGIPRFVRLTFG